MINLTTSANPSSVLNINGGIFQFTSNSGELQLETSAVINWNSGDIIPKSNGNQVFISIGTQQYTGSTLNRLSPPIQLTSTGFAPLPVELMRFVANEFNGQVLLEWATASELDNSGFAIQRSMDGNTWMEIGWVDGFGTSQVLRNYYFEDLNPLEGANDYRLQQVDYDGKIAYSPIVIVDMEATWKQPTIAPNPMTENAQLVIPEDWNGGLISIFDLQGRLVRQWQANSAIVRISDLNSGLYIVRVHQGRNLASLRLLV